MSDTDVQEAPCTIHTKDGRAFVVDSVGGWRYMDWCIYASGYWAFESSERDELIPYSEVKHITLDFAALERYHAAQLIAELDSTLDDPVLDEEPEAEAA